MRTVLISCDQCGRRYVDSDAAAWISDGPRDFCSKACMKKHPVGRKSSPETSVIVSMVDACWCKKPSLAKSKKHTRGCQKQREHLGELTWRR